MRKDEKENRQIVKDRSEGKCERCNADLYGQLASIHHRKPRQMGGTSVFLHTIQNMVVLCGSGTTGCHGWVESNRDMAREQGWLLRNLSDQLEPVYTLHNGWVRFTTVGIKELLGKKWSIGSDG
ncbi:MAG: hypothetical protein WAS05_09150 [Candidatus Nanopelagicales bacterium]